MNASIIIEGKNVTLTIAAAALRQMAIMQDAWDTGKFASITLFTSVKTAGGKKNPFADKVFSKSTNTVQGLIDYQAAVNRRREAEGIETDFISQDSKVGSRVYIDGKASIFLANMNTGCIYVQYSHLKTQQREYIVNGETFPEAKDEWNLYTPPKRDAAETSQGVENQVVIRSPKLESILAISAGGMQITFAEDRLTAPYVTAE